MFEIATAVVVLVIFGIFAFGAFKAEKSVAAKIKLAQEVRAKAVSESKAKTSKASKK